MKFIIPNQTQAGTYTSQKLAKSQSKRIRCVIIYVGYVCVFKTKKNVFVNMVIEFKHFRLHDWIIYAFYHINELRAMIKIFHLLVVCIWTRIQLLSSQG